MDKFPEAFDRYEEWLKNNRLQMPKQWKKLVEDMQNWGLRRFRGTRRQLNALKTKAKRLGIEDIPDEPEMEPARTLDYYEYQEQQEQREEAKERLERGEPREQ